MKGAEASGPPCDRNKAFCGSSGPTTDARNSGLDQQPNLPNLGRRNHFFLNTVGWSRWLARWGGACIGPARPMRAMPLNLTALLKPSPPWPTGGYLLLWRNSRWHLDPHPPTCKNSSRSAHHVGLRMQGQVGLTVRDEEIRPRRCADKRTNQAHCRSWMSGILCRNAWCSAALTSS